MRPLVSLIDRLRSQERRVRISKGFALFATTVFASVWVMTVIESLLSLPPNGRIALWAGLLLIVGFGTLRTAWRDYQGVPNPRDAAKLIESEFPQFEESLAAGLEFTTSGPPFGESVDLAVAVADQADERSLGLDIGQLTDTKPLRRWASAFALSALLWAITIWQFAPTALPAFTRLTHPLTRYTTAPQLTLSLLPGSVELVKGDSLATQTLATGAIPESITLQSRKTGSLVWLDTYVTVGDQRIASHVLGPINESIDYRAKAEDAVSQTHTVTAIDPPVARRLWAVLTPPRYAGLPSQELPEGDGNIEGLVDTKASITLNSSKPLQGVWAVFASGDTIEGLTDKHEAKLSFRVQRSGTYALRLLDTQGYYNKNPIDYQVTALPDEYPSVAVVEPGQDRDLSNDFVVELIVEGADDFGFSRLSLIYRGPSGVESTTDIPFTKIDRRHMAARWVWDLGGLVLLPDDRVTYKAQVWDNDRATGPKSSDSRTYTLRFPSVEEIFDESLHRQQAEVAKGEDILERTRELRQTLEQMRRELLKTREMDWDRKQQTARVLEEEQQLGEQVEDMVEQLEQSMEKLERHNVLGSETMEKILQIRELMRELIPAEMRERLQELMSDMQKKFNPQEMTEAMERVAQDQRNLEERLDRTLELLKRAQTEQRMDALAKQLEEIADRQERIKDKIAESSNDNLSREQQELADATRRAQEQLEQLSQDVPQETGETAGDSLSDLASQMEQQRLSQRMDELSRQLSEGRTGSEQKQQAQELSQSMRDAADKMRKMAHDMKSDQQQQDMTAMRKIVADLVSVSFLQENAWQVTEDGGGGVINDLAEDQQMVLQATQSLTNRLAEAGRQMAHMPAKALVYLGGAAQDMHSAIAQISERRPNLMAMSTHQETAMGLINDAVLTLMHTLDQSQQQQQLSGGGLEQLMEALGQLTEQQQALGSGFSPLLGRTPGSLSPSEQAALAQMSTQQEAIRRALERLREQLEQYEQVLGDLGKVGSGMDQQAQDLRRGRLGNDVLDRQRRIIRKLLDAQRSIHNQGQGRRREATAAKSFDPSNPGELPQSLGERRMLLREMMMRALRAGYPPEYRDLIRRYYQRLIDMDAVVVEAP